MSTEPNPCPRCGEPMERVEISTMADRAPVYVEGCCCLFDEIAGDAKERRHPEAAALITS